MFRLLKPCAMVFVPVLFLSLTTPVWAGDMQGKIKNVYPDKSELVVENSQGQTLTFLMDEDAQVTIDGAQATLSDLRIGDRVTILGRRNGDLWLAIAVLCQRE